MTNSIFLLQIGHNVILACARIQKLYFDQLDQTFPARGRARLVPVNL